MVMAIAASSLPAVDSIRIRELNLSALPNRFSVYRIILRAEQQAVTPQDIMSARVVGYLLLEFHERSHIFGDAPCASLARCVTSMPRNEGGSENDVVYGLGILLRDKFIRLFRSSSAPYQLPTTHPSRGSFDTLEDMIKDTMEPTGKYYGSTRQKALTRDGFRCVVTGMLDQTSVEHCRALVDEVERDGTTMVTIEVAHILNESTTQGIDPEGASEGTTGVNKTDAAGAMAILESFGFSDFTEAFRKPGGVHRVWNLLSLEHNLHERFDALGLWFEHTQQPGRYKICLSHQSDEGWIRRNFEHRKPHVDGAPMVVEFTSRFEEAPPPDPRLLALHATCARVAHMSGAAAFFGRLERDAEETKVLAFDGSSALLLSNLMYPFSMEATSCIQASAGRFLCARRTHNITIRDNQSEPP